jgi:hypothetical protein
LDSVDDLRRVGTQVQFAEPYGQHGVPEFTEFPMSQNAHVIMLVPDWRAGAERILRYKMLTHFTDIPVVRAL